jgi:hypothetical protein
MTTGNYIDETDPFVIDRVDDLEERTDNPDIIGDRLLLTLCEHLSGSMDRKCNVARKHELDSKEFTNYVVGVIRTVPLVDGIEDSAEKLLVLTKVKFLPVTSKLFKVSYEQLGTHGPELSRVRVHTNSNTISDLVDLSPRRESTKEHTIDDKEV